MLNLFELKSVPQIKNDQDIETWKSTWDGKCETIPAEVHNYMLSKLDNQVLQLSKLESVIDSYLK